MSAQTDLFPAGLSPAAEPMPDDITRSLSGLIADLVQRELSMSHPRLGYFRGLAAGAQGKERAALLALARSISTAADK